MAPTAFQCKFQCHCVVDVLLVIGQDLLEAADSRKIGEDISGHVASQHSLQFRISRVLRSDLLLQQLVHSACGLHGKPASEISDSINQVLPFLDNYLAFFERYISEYSTWTNALLNFAYISGRLLLNIAHDGFCRPSDTEDTDSAEGPVESAEGTGIGQGEGKERSNERLASSRKFVVFKDCGKWKGSKGCK